MLDHDLQKKVIARLNRVGGQVAGISRMVENDAYCVDVLRQISAVQAALGKVGSIILESHMNTCVAQAFDSGRDRERRQKIEELLEVFNRYGRVGSK